MLCLVLVAAGTSLSPHNPIFWFAGYGPKYQWMRGIVSLILFLQLITSPARHMSIRIAAGTLAIAIGAWALIATYLSHMLVLDTLSLLAAALAIGAAALEVEPTSLPEPNLFVAYIEQSPLWLQAATLN